VSLTRTVKVPFRSWARVEIPVAEVEMIVSVVGLAVFVAAEPEGAPETYAWALTESLPAGLLTWNWISTATEVIVAPTGMVSKPKSPYECVPVSPRSRSTVAYAPSSAYAFVGSSHVPATALFGGELCQRDSEHRADADAQQEQARDGGDRDGAAAWGRLVEAGHRSGIPFSCDRHRAARDGTGVV
jgi:hypothetical protein